MNFKKFISGVSAFAIAASAFAGMAVTANAETLYTQDYESGTVDWTTATGGRFTPVILEEDGNKYLSVDQATRNNNGTTISSTAVSIDADKDYTLAFDFKVSSSTNQTPAEFKVYNKAGDGKVFSLTATGTWTTAWKVNEGDSITLAGTGSNDELKNIPWYAAVITSSGDKLYVTIADKATGTAIIDKKAVTGSTAAGIGKFEFVTKRYNANFAIDNVLVRDVEADDLPSTPQGDFSVVYKTEAGATLTKTSSGSGDVGSAPSITAADKADFVENGQKYIYVSDNAANVTIAGDNTTVVTVTVRAAASYKVTVKGSEGTEFANKDVFEGDSTSYAYPKYITDDNKKVTYETSYTTYSAEVTPTESTDVTIPYTAYEGTAYFVDHEKITNTAALGSGNYSNGSASRAVNDGVVAFTVAEAGTYDITVAASCRNTSSNSVFAVYKNEVTDANLIFNDNVKGASQNNVQTEGIKTKTDVELAAGDVIIIQGDNGNTWIDYVLAVKKPVVNSVEATVDEGAAYTVADGYDKDMVVGVISLEVTGSYDLANATYEGKTGAVTGDSGTVITDATASVIVVINGATSTDALSQVKFN